MFVEEMEEREIKGVGMEDKKVMIGMAKRKLKVLCFMLLLSSLHSISKHSGKKRVSR